jgi:hypothetical protein
VDEKRNAVVAVLKIEFIDGHTGEVAAKERGVTQYLLAADQNDDITIKKLPFFPQRLARGTLSGTETFFRDLE